MGGFRGTKVLQYRVTDVPKCCSAEVDVLKFRVTEFIRCILLKYRCAEVLLVWILQCAEVLRGQKAAIITTWC